MCNIYTAVWLSSGDLKGWLGMVLFMVQPQTNQKVGLETNPVHIDSWAIQIPAFCFRLFFTNSIKNSWKFMAILQFTNIALWTTNLAKVMTNFNSSIGLCPSLRLTLIDAGSYRILHFSIFGAPLLKLKGMINYIMQKLDFWKISKIICYNWS